MMALLHRTKNGLMEVAAMSNAFLPLGLEPRLAAKLLTASS